MSSRPFGIQRKIFLTFGLFFSLVVAGGGWVAARYITSVSMNQAEERQFQEVALLARALDDKFRSHLQSLEAVATRLPPQVLLDSRSADAWLRDRSGLRATFNHGIFLLTPGGRILAQDAPGPAASRVPAQLRPFLGSVAELGKPGASRAYLAEGATGPVIMLAVPGRSRDGRVHALLAGGIDLLRDDLLSTISQHPIPGSGELSLIDSRRRVLLHHDRARLLTDLDPPGPQDLVERGLRGFEGSGERVDQEGVRTISSLKRLHAIDGILLADIPVAEVLGPIERLRWYLKVATAAEVALSLFLTWLISHRLTDNLEDVTRQIRTLGDLPSGSRIIRIHGDDEVSDLARSFNGMIGRLEGHEARLAKAQAEIEEELGITKHILHRLVEPGLRALPPGFHMETLQTGRINGDACTYRPGHPGIHFGLICDATGHGLTAGVSTLPTVQTFLSMAERDIPLETIYQEINAKLRQILPGGRFVCLLLLRLDLRHASLAVLNAGLPDAVLLSATAPTRKLSSLNLPAGVVSDPGPPVVERFAVQEGERIFAFTDGLQDLLGDRLGALITGGLAGGPFNAAQGAVQKAIAQGSWDQEQQDDVSWALWEVPVHELPESAMPPPPPADTTESLRTTFSVDLTLVPRLHPIQDVLPPCIRLLEDLGLPAEVGPELAMALTESLGNAVDHGLLRLDPRWKEAGFEVYEAKRRAALTEQVEGAIHLRLRLRSDAGGQVREVAVEVEDPGPGFDWRAWREQSCGNGPKMGGQGLLRLRSVTCDLGFNPAGNIIRFSLPCG